MIKISKYVNSNQLSSESYISTIFFWVTFVFSEWSITLTRKFKDLSFSPVIVPLYNCQLWLKNFTFKPIFEKKNTKHSFISHAFLSVTKTQCNLAWVCGSHRFKAMCHHFWVGLLLHPPKSDGRYAQLTRGALEDRGHRLPVCNTFTNKKTSFLHRISGWYKLAKRCSNSQWGLWS